MDVVDPGQLDWRKLRDVAAIDTDVLPVAVQDVDSGAVVMVAYLSREALEESVRTGRAVFHSTSRDVLHRKGETSGDVLDVIGLRANCELNSVLMLVRKRGTGACHERDADGDHRPSCFFRTLEAGARIELAAS